MYYRKFIKGFTHIATPLYGLIEKLKPWEWTGLCNVTFGQLKANLSSPPILSFPQFNMEFTVDCDASLEGLRAVLSQKNDRCVVAYASRNQSPELLCLSVIAAIMYSWGFKNSRDVLEPLHPS